MTWADSLESKIKVLIPPAAESNIIYCPLFGADFVCVAVMLCTKLSYKDISLSWSRIRLWTLFNVANDSFAKAIHCRIRVIIDLLDDL